MGNTVFVRANGPLIVRGHVKVIAADGSLLLDNDEAYLCRCGQSQNKPFCDGAHKTCGFSDAATFKDEKAEALGATADLTISVRSSAMLIASGPMTIQNEEGTCQTTRNKAAFCRCGASANKPFCDASHKRCEFQAD